MKKTVIAALFAAALAGSAALCSCTTNEEGNPALYIGDTEIASYREAPQTIMNGAMIAIDSSHFYDTDTKIIYIGRINGFYEPLALSPYLSENGKYCRYIDGQFAEID